MCWLIDNMYVNLQKHMKKSLKIFVAAKFFQVFGVFRNPSAGRQGFLLGGVHVVDDYGDAQLYRRARRQRDQESYQQALDSEQ